MITRKQIDDGILETIGRCVSVAMRFADGWHAFRAAFRKNDPLKIDLGQEPIEESDFSRSADGTGVDRVEQLETVMNHVAQTQVAIISELREVYAQFIEFKATQEGEDFEFDDGDETMYN
jgi:hypothetical protein